jgi:putative glutamine amidotransferase
LDITSPHPGAPAEREGAAPIAVSCLKPRDCECGRVPRDYINALRLAQASSTIVPTTYDLCEGERAPEGAEVWAVTPDDTSVLDVVSGLVLTGGGDVDPALYGQERHPRTYNVSPRRDRLEIGLLGEALGRDMPVLAICRGMQVLNVALGGTLEQHLVDVAGRLEHDRDRPRAEPAHDVRVVQGTLLARLLGARASVNSRHHQGLDVVADALQEAAHAPDGVLEAVVAPAYSWVLAVQWHPEAMVPMERSQEAIFASFVDAAKIYARRGARLRSA